ncbi:hypothetical protein M6B38_233570 [Iris pallida]|uniref:Uncharacterized protein n=1 Tax=Iris pallida TaxID=29817 RepID=A0AAX6DQQ2_IRIPA|nr:hypothetical protein M6B38_233570 [Iris pallida]
MSTGPAIRAPPAHGCRHHVAEMLPSPSPQIGDASHPFLQCQLRDGLASAADRRQSPYFADPTIRETGSGQPTLEPPPRRRVPCHRSVGHSKLLIDLSIPLFLIFSQLGFCVWGKKKMMLEIRIWNI